MTLSARRATRRAEPGRYARLVRECRSAERQLAARADGQHTQAADCGADAEGAQALQTEQSSAPPTPKAKKMFKLLRQRLGGGKAAGAPPLLSPIQQSPPPAEGDAAHDRADDEAEPADYGALGAVAAPVEPLQPAETAAAAALLNPFAGEPLQPQPPAALAAAGAALAPVSEGATSLSPSSSTVSAWTAEQLEVWGEAQAQVDKDLPRTFAGMPSSAAASAAAQLLQERTAAIYESPTRAHPAAHASALAAAPSTCDDAADAAAKEQGAAAAADAEFAAAEAKAAGATGVPREGSTWEGYPEVDAARRQQLRRLLLAYARYNPAVGYCQARQPGANPVL